MKFNIKSAMEYSSKLKNVICDVSNSLRANTSLINRYSNDNDVNEIPAVNNGIYTGTITHKKSQLNNVIGKNLDDEVIKVEPTSDLSQLSPDIRLKLLNDLMQERANIDYEIETIKNGSKIVDEFTGKEVTYDLGCQINKMYREYNQGVLRGLVEMDSILKTTVTGKMTVVSGSDDKGSALVSYPIEIEAKSNVTNTDVLKQYDEINNKCTINSAKLSEVEISKFFEYEPKFNLNPSIRSLIEKYKEVK